MHCLLRVKVTLLLQLLLVLLLLGHHALEVLLNGELRAAIQVDHLQGRFESVDSALRLTPRQHGECLRLLSELSVQVLPCAVFVRAAFLLDSSLGTEHATIQNALYSLLPGVEFKHRLLGLRLVVEAIDWTELDREAALILR